MDKLSSLRSTSSRACNLPPSAFVGSSTAMMRQLLKMGNSSPREISVTVILSMKDGFFSGLFMAAFRELRIEEVGESFSEYAVCLYWAIVCAIRTLNQSSDSGWWDEWCIRCRPCLVGFVGMAL